MKAITKESNRKRIFLIQRKKYIGKIINMIKRNILDQQRELEIKNNINVNTAQKHF